MGYIVDENNGLVYIVAKSMINKNDQTSDTSNPLVIFGGKGLGKTSLLKYLNNYAEETKAREKIVFQTGQQFLDNSNNSKEIYKGVDLLLVDDIKVENFLTVDAITDFINSLIKDGCQIILTCSEFPHKEYSDIQGRFKNILWQEIKLPRCI